jgi:hypothetical protein
MHVLGRKVRVGHEDAETVVQGLRASRTVPLLRVGRLEKVEASPCADRVRAGAAPAFRTPGVTTPSGFITDDLGQLVLIAATPSREIRTCEGPTCFVADPGGREWSMAIVALQTPLKR